MKKGTKLVEYDPIFLAEAFIEWLSAAHGVKTHVLNNWAAVLGISPQHMHRLLKDFNNFRPYIEAKYSNKRKPINRWPPLVR